DPAFFFAGRRRHTRFSRDWSSAVCSSDLVGFIGVIHGDGGLAPVALVQPESQTLTVIETDQYAGDQIDQSHNGQQTNHPAAHDPGKVEIKAGKTATELKDSSNTHRKQ